MSRAPLIVLTHYGTCIAVLRLSSVALERPLVNHVLQEELRHVQLVGWNEMPRLRHCHQDESERRIRPVIASYLLPILQIVDLSRLIPDGSRVCLEHVEESKPRLHGDWSICKIIFSTVG